MSRLWGVGKRSQEALEAVGLRHIGDIAATPLPDLEEMFGSLGSHIHALSLGDDPRRVVAVRESKSIGSETTLEWDIQGREAIRPYVLRAADTVANRLRNENLHARGVRVKLRTTDFKLHTRQLSLDSPTQLTHDLVAGADQLLDEFDLSQPVRLVGIAAFDLAETDAGQLGLFDGEEKVRHENLDRAVDKVWDKFGRGALKRGRDI